MKHSFIIFSGLMLANTLTAQAKRPNVILILADDMRSSTLGYSGKESIKTPNLDGLAQESTVFSKAYIMGSCNGAVSMPSRAMLLTGKYLDNLVEEGSRLPNEHITIGESLKKNGYNTYHTGKWHNDKASFNRTFSSGDDIFFGGMADHWNVPLYHYDSTAVYAPKRRVTSNFMLSNEIEMQPGEYVYSGLHSVDIFTDSALRFLREQASEEAPFFLSLAYMSPHDPRTMPDEFSKQYPADQMQLPANFMTEHPFPIGDMDIRDERLAAFPRHEDEVKKHISDYYAMISHMDARIGDIISELKRTGQYDNTIIIFAADNGLAVGQHSLMGKQNLYEHSIGVPLIIKSISQSGVNRSTDKLCYLIDLFPTICELTGTEIPLSVDGKSLKPILDEDKTVRPYLSFGYKNCQRAITDGQWKMIRTDVNGVRNIQLFNLKDDPFEIKNLLVDKTGKKHLKRMTDLLDKARAEVNDNIVFF